MSIDYYHPLDINECSDNIDGCEHACINTLGSYHCVCDQGFTLGSDSHTCLGLFSLFTNMNMIVSMYYYSCLKRS